MANEEQLAILKQGADVWNKWRIDNPKVLYPDLSNADFSGINLVQANLSEAILSNANLSGAFCKGVNFQCANLESASLSHAYLIDANLTYAYLRRANLEGALLRGAHLYGANLSKADLSKADLSGANLMKGYLEGAFLTKSYLIQSNLIGSNLQKTDLTKADFRKANLTDACLVDANLMETNLRGANLTGADLSRANLYKANLREAFLLRTVIDKAKFSGSSVYSINVWDLIGEFEEQKDLVITREGEAAITVDNVRVAQFIYLILNNKEIRGVINALTSKAVLILGRFSISERKAILDALRNKLREYDLLPIVFDFDRPTDKDFTETIITLAGLSYFVIADVTSPKSTPLELQAIAPHLQVPFVPIIQGEQPFAMMMDLQKKYPWVLDTVSYDSLETLMKALKPAIIDPAIQKHNELRLAKARQPKILSASDFIDDKGLDSKTSSGD